MMTVAGTTVVAVEGLRSDDIQGVVRKDLPIDRFAQ